VRKIALAYGSVAITKESQAYHHITYRGADKSLARPTPRCILFDG